MTATTPLAGRAASDADYQPLGLSRGTVAPWKDRAGVLVEEFADKAIWELMYFGRAR
jgi:hypothetical protein